MSHLRAAEYPRPYRTLVHLSDTHFVGLGEELYGSVRPEERLNDLMDSLTESHVSAEALIITGDLTSWGEPAAYRELSAVISTAAEKLGAEVIWVMGNHDVREVMRQELLGEDPSSEPDDRVVMIGGLRVVVLDSTVPGEDYGDLDEQQLTWLAKVLSTPAPEGTLLAMHHPPVPCVQDFYVTVELRNQTRLADVLRGSDVRSILAGHFHYSTSATFAGIQVSVAASTCYTQDLLTPDRGLRGRDDAQSLNLVNVYDHTVMHSVVPRVRGETVGQHLDAAASADLLTQNGMYIPTRQQTTLRSP